MVMLWNLVVLVGFVVERGGGQKAGHPTYTKNNQPLSRVPIVVNIHLSLSSDSRDNNAVSSALFSLNGF